MSIITKIIILALAGLLLSGGTILGLNYIAKNYVQTPNETSDNNAENASFGFNFLKSSLQQGDKLNILFLGISGENYTSGNLTDSIIFVSINLESQKINLISIPRDLWVNSENGDKPAPAHKELTRGKQKINELYRIEGGEVKPDVSYASLLKGRVSEIIGQDIQYTAVVDLDGIKNIVNLIGGIDTEEGFMNGEQALFYIRDRSRPGNDFDRMLRQQKLIIAIIQKISKNQEELLQNQETTIEFLQLAQKNFNTDISILEIFSLSQTFKDIDPQEIGLYTITTNNLLKEEYRDINGQSIYILYPRAGEEDYSEIQNFVSEILEKF